MIMDNGAVFDPSIIALFVKRISEITPSVRINKTK